MRKDSRFKFIFQNDNQLIISIDRRLAPEDDVATWIVLWAFAATPKAPISLSQGSASVDSDQQAKLVVASLVTRLLTHIALTGRPVENLAELIHGQMSEESEAILMQAIEWWTR